VSSPIDEFLSRYPREYDFFEQAAHLCMLRCEAELRHSGVRAIVTARAKRQDSLKAKLAARDKMHGYTSIDEIWRDIKDLAGVRIALYFPGDRDEVGRMLKSTFEVVAPPKVFPSRSDAPKMKFEKRFAGYVATHYLVRLKPEQLPPDQVRYCDAAVEVQVASVLMHAWAEVEHDLIYKPLAGDASKEEYSILDELNGLVLTGEIALERLQSALRSRVRTEPFQNHYELAAYLYDKAGQEGAVPEPIMGRADRLFRFLQQANMLQPQQVEPFVQDIEQGEKEPRPLVEAVIDRILLENPALYSQYESIRHNEGRNPYSASDEHYPDKAPALLVTLFVQRWALLERTLRAVSAVEPGKWLLDRGMSPTEYLSQQQHVKFASIRRLRNSLVHGEEMPDDGALEQATEELAQLLVSLSKHSDVRVRSALRQATESLIVDPDLRPRLSDNPVPSSQETV